MNTFDMEKIFKMTQPQLKSYLRKWLMEHGYEITSGKKNKFIYAKGSDPVAVIAHMDTVHKEPVSQIFKTNTGMWMALEGIGGDDRCGVIIILSLIERGYHPTVIFTEDEEIGCVGAGAFIKKYPQPTKNIKFLVEFDRKGSNDCVFYSCDNPEFTKYIEGFGFKEDWGSFSDIAEIAPVWGLAAVNLSSGYYNAHTTSEYIVLPEIETVIQRAEKIIQSARLKTTPKYEYIEETYRYGRGIGFGDYYGYYDDYSSYGYSEYPFDYRGYNLSENKEKEGDKNRECAYGEYVSPLYSGYALVTTEDGETAQYDLAEDEFYIDADGWLYVAVPEADWECLMQLDGIAYTDAGIPARFDENNAVYMEVL